MLLKVPLFILLFFFIYLPLIPYSYGVEVFVFVLWMYTQSVGLLGRVIGLSQSLYLNTVQHEHRTNAHTHKTFMPEVGFEPTIMEEWRRSSSVLVLGTRWRWVVKFTPRPLYPRKYSPRYKFDRKLGGPQSRSGRCGEEENVTPPGI
jgi:hypothetical protein